MIKTNGISRDRQVPRNYFAGDAALLPSPLVGEGGASRSEATGEGFVPQASHHRPTAKRIRNFAKKMRREPTDAEAAMWRLPRGRRLEFRRQAPFQNLILDFVCFEKQFIIEIDGSSMLTLSAMLRETLPS
jgi:hypothetical protein